MPMVSLEQILYDCCNDINEPNGLREHIWIRIKEYIVKLNTDGGVEDDDIG